MPIISLIRINCQCFVDIKIKIIYNTNMEEISMYSNEKIAFLLHIDKELKNNLMQLATEDERSLTSYINIVLKNHVAKCKDVKESE